MRPLVALLAGAIGFLMAIASVLAVLAIVQTAADSDPPQRHTPAPAAPTPAPTEPPPTTTPTPQATPPPTPTPHPLARCLTADGRSLDLEQLLWLELQGMYNSVYAESVLPPPTVSITGATAINIRHVGGGLYLHSAAYSVTTQYHNRAETQTVTVRGTVRASSCAAELR